MRNLPGIAAAMMFITCAGNSMAATFSATPIDEGRGIDVITRSLARESLGRDLFGEPHSGVVIGNIDIYDRFPYVESRYFMVVSDPKWDRLLYGVVEGDLAAFDGGGGPFGPLSNPRGMAVDASGKLFVADTGNRRVVVFEASNVFDRLTLEPLYEIVGLARPFDVAASDGGTPDRFDDDLLYVADAGSNKVVRFRLGEESATLAGSLGELGSGNGYFAGPTAIAAGRTNGSNNGVLYVADAHNRRIVRLLDDGDVLTWLDSRSMDASMVSSLDTDQFGNVYAAAPHAGSVTKYSPALAKVGEWAAGIDQPRSFHIPFLRVTDHTTGLSTIAGQGSGLLVERWSGDGGIRLAKLGIEVSQLEISGSHPVEVSWLQTDHADVTVDVVDRVTGRTLMTEDGGTRSAGHQSIRLALHDAAKRISRTNLSIRVSAKSAYHGGGSSTAMIDIDAPGAETPPAPVRLQVAPNPFNPSTIISFTVNGSAKSRAQLHIYDIGGRLVRVLGGVGFGPGAHDVPWDGTNEAGRPAGSGVYVARLSYDDVEENRNMVLLR